VHIPLKEAKRLFELHPDDEAVLEGVQAGMVQLSLRAAEEVEELPVGVAAHETSPLAPNAPPSPAAPMAFKATESAVGEPTDETPRPGWHAGLGSPIPFPTLSTEMQAALQGDPRVLGTTVAGFGGFYWGGLGDFYAPSSRAANVPGPPLTPVSNGVEDASPKGTHVVGCTAAGGPFVDEARRVDPVFIHPAATHITPEQQQALRTRKATVFHFLNETPHEGVSIVCGDRVACPKYRVMKDDGANVRLFSERLVTSLGLQIRPYSAAIHTLVADP